MSSQEEEEEESYVLEGDDGLEEDGVAVGGDDGRLLHGVVERRPAWPVEVKMGWVGDDEGGVDGPAGAADGGRRRGRGGGGGVRRYSVHLH